MSQSVPFSRMMAFAFSSESSSPDCIWQIVRTLLRATASQHHVGRRDSLLASRRARSGVGKARFSGSRAIAQLLR
jgi:hypothetical protein